MTEKDGRFTFVMPACNVTLTPIFERQPAQNVSFDDVKPTEWYADAVRCVVEKGLMSGTGTDAFSPDGTTTRGMLMTILARYAGADTTDGANWYEKGMAWASRQAFRMAARRRLALHESSSSPCCTAMRMSPKPAAHWMPLQTQIPSAPTRSMLCDGRQRTESVNGLARQAESTWECHPCTGRGNADAVL